MGKYTALQSEEQKPEAIEEKIRTLERWMLGSVIFFVVIVIAGFTTFAVLYVKEHNDNETQRKSMENEHTRRINSLLSTVDKLRTEVNTRNAIRDALSMKIKSVEQKLISIQNFTTREPQQLRGKLDNTIESLRDTQKTINTFEDELNSTKQDIVHIFNTESNRSHHSALKIIASSLHSSLRNVNGTIVNLRQDIEKNTRNIATQYKTITEELSRTKVKFKELERKLENVTSGMNKTTKSQRDAHISLRSSLETVKEEFERKLEGATSKKERMTDKLASLENVTSSQQIQISEEQQELKDQREDINHLKSMASSNLHLKECVNMPFVIALSLVIKYI